MFSLVTEPPAIGSFASDLPFGLPLPDPSPRELLASQQTNANDPRTLEVGIPVRDGIELAADVYLPLNEQLPAPAIVIGTPYDKSGAAVTAFREAGYATIVYDCRGRGKSEGEFRAFDNIERQDGYDVVEWVAAQDWCSSKIGVSGVSYGGWLVWATIAEKPPHLSAAISTAAAGRWQQELPYTYGCFWLYWAFWFALVRRRILDRNFVVSELVEMLPVSAIGDVLKPSGPSWDDFLDHEALDEFWQSRRWDGEYDFELPCLHVSGWHDREDIQGAFHHYEQMMETSPARDSQWLIVGPWSHASTRSPSNEYAGVATPNGGIDMTAIQVRFFDRFLKDHRNGIDAEPRVWLYDTGRGTWCIRDEWQSGTTNHHLYLGQENVLMSRPDSDGEASFQYDPTCAPGVRFDTNGPWEPPLDLADLESQDGVLTWTSKPAGEALTVRGWSHLDLYASTDCDDTEWHVKLADVDQAGRSLCVAWGCLRASHNADPADPRPVEAGVVTQYGIELTPAFHTFLPGHCIRLVVASAEYPWFARNMNEFARIAEQHSPRVATNTIHLGPHRPSALTLQAETVDTAHSN